MLGVSARAETARAPQRRGPAAGRNDQEKCRRQYVDDDRTDEGQAKWSETSAQQNQTAADLKTFHGVKIMAGDERIHKVSGQTGWRWRHGDEIKKCVQPEYKKYEP